jgi:hypothetical protein
MDDFADLRISYHIDQRRPRSTDLTLTSATSHLTLASKIVNRNGPINLLPLSMALRFLDESDRRLNDLRPMMSIIPDDLFAATARPQMATRTRIADQRVQRPTRPPPASPRGTRPPQNTRRARPSSSARRPLPPLPSVPRKWTPDGGIPISQKCSQSDTRITGIHIS